MNYKKYAQEFWENGYVIIENFFNDKLMDHLNKVILNHYGMNPNWEHNNEFISKSATEVVPWFPFREGNNDFEIIENDERLNNLQKLF